MPLTDSRMLRAMRVRAYRQGKYRMAVPPVYTGNWDEEAWCNWVKFDDGKLTGFLPYDRQLQLTAISCLTNS